jgi:hypothetical protein
MALDYMAPAAAAQDWGYWPQQRPPIAAIAITANRGEFHHAQRVAGDRKEQTIQPLTRRPFAALPGIGKSRIVEKRFVR